MKVEKFQIVTGSRALARNSLVASLVLSLMIPVVAESRVIFEDDFDDHEPWDGSMASERLPEGWSRVRHDPTWAPSTGYPDKHEAIEILPTNQDKARGGEGQSYVAWRDYYDAGWNQWQSDSILAKYYEDGYEQLYVEFYITFDDDWTPTGQSKLFRISSWAGDGDFFGYGGGRDNGPVFIFDYAHSGTYGVRNFLSFRSGPHGENYTFSNDDIEGFSRNLIGSGDASMSFMNDFDGENTGGESPFIRNKLTGQGSITELGRDPVHEELYGKSGTWTKYAFFVEMNSEPGAADGSFMQWIDDELVIENHNLRWNKENSENKHPKWNVVAIGGNDFWRGYSNEDRREEWYAIDDFMIATEIPDYLMNSSQADGVEPMPPANVMIVE